MTRLTRFLLDLLPSIESQHDRDEAFLAGAVDLRDLERRMRTLDARGRGDFSAVAAGLYPR
jgi:hypothetical protein